MLHLRLVFLAIPIAAAISFSSERSALSTEQTKTDGFKFVFPPTSSSQYIHLISSQGDASPLFEAVPILVAPSVVAVCMGPGSNQKSLFQLLDKLNPADSRILLTLPNTDVSAYRYLFDLRLSVGDVSSPAANDACNIHVDLSGPCNHTISSSEKAISSTCANNSTYTCTPHRPVRIAFVSDWGYIGEGGLAATAASANKRVFDRYIFGGDNVYETGIASVHDSRMTDLYVNNFNKVLVPQYVVEGNHDAFGSYLAQLLYSQYQQYWRAEYYYFNHTVSSRDVTVCLLLIDTERFSMSGQESFIHSVLGSPECQQSDYILIAGHHPVFSSGGHGDSSLFKAKLLPILTHYKVDLYICGHDHTMSVHEDSGVRFVIAGASGRRTTDTFFLSTSKASRTLFSTYNKYGYADLQFGSDFLELKLVDSMLDQTLFSHNWASRKTERLESDRSGSVWPVPVQGTTPFYSFSTFVMMISICLVWIGGFLSIKIREVFTGAKN